MASPRLTEPAFRRLDRHLTGSTLPDEFDAGAIREQVDRILSSSLFHSSRRNSSLLKHVVHRALDGRSDELKERNIGIDVFGRAPDYDTNTDHVVRSVAGEVRRRLAQYYVDPAHECELRIDLQAGSYVPQFRLPAERPIPASSPAAEPVIAIRPQAPQIEKAWRLSRKGHRAILAGALALSAAALAFWFRGPSNAFERFWQPFFSASSPALLCFGGGGQDNPTSEANLALPVSDYEHLSFRRMHTLDAIAVANLAGLLQANGKPYRIVNRASSTSFRDLQSGPFVLVGGMNNEWTLRLTSGLRFSFERQPNGGRVADKQNPANTTWSVDFKTPLGQFNRDYAIVSRIRDPRTEQPVVIAAGIGSWGTLAAGEFVSRPEHLDKLEKLAPKHWERKNLQVVLATDVIRGSSGPPIVLAAHFW
jgi:hypothetical protein